MALLSLRDVNVKYKVKNKTVHAVNDVSFDVNQNDSIGIVGESGSGKSTLANAILRLLPKNIAEVSGDIDFDNRKLLKLNEEQLRALRWAEISVVFQKSMNSLSPVHKVGDQMSDIYRVHEKEVSKEEVKDRMIELLEMVNLPRRVFTMYPHELSGGMMQRVSIALGLMHNPKLIILDEATSALDVVTEGQILEEIVQLEEKLNIARLMITHDMSVVATSCKKVAVMYAGHMLEFGMVKDVLSSPKHPYTVGLMKSIPSLKGERKELKGIPGSLPDLSNMPKGCVFAPRCSECEEICKSEKPKSIKLSDGSIVACHKVRGDL